MSKTVVLKPGEFHFGGDVESIRTLLGSCIAITLWHPQRKIGGMCHFLLPANPKPQAGLLDGRYADDAMKLFTRHLTRSGTVARDYQVKIFGGGNMFPKLSPEGGDIGMRNIDAAKRLLKEQGFRLLAEHVGKSGHRTVILELHSGHTWVRWQE